MQEVDTAPTDTRCLDELHPWSRLVVASFEDIETRGFIVRKFECFVAHFGILEVVFRRLEVIDLAVFRTRDDGIESILHDEDIARKSVFCIRGSRCGDDLSYSWRRDLGESDSCPGVREEYADSLCLVESRIFCEGGRTLILCTREATAREEE